MLKVDYYPVPDAGECEDPSRRKRVFACDSFEHATTSVVKGDRSSPRNVETNEESPSAVRFLFHPPSEKRRQRQTKMECLCVNRHTKNLLSEFKILGTGKMKTGPSMNLVMSGDMYGGPPTTDASQGKPTKTSKVISSLHFHY